MNVQMPYNQAIAEGRGSFQMLKNMLEFKHAKKEFYVFSKTDSLAKCAIVGGTIKIPKNTLHAARCPSPATYVVGFESEVAAKSFRPELPENLP